MKISRVGYEAKIIGCSLTWISFLAAAVFVSLRFTGGGLVNWSYLGFEVLFPLYTAIMVSECAKTRSDPMFEVVEAQSASLFRWVLARFLFVFTVTGVFAFLGMLAVRMTGPSPGFGELAFLYLTTAFFLSSFAVLCSLFTASPHAAAAACGVLWLFDLLAKSLLRFPPVPYFYPFLRFADENSPLWFRSKCVLACLGVAMWVLIGRMTRSRAVLRE